MSSAAYIKLRERSFAIMILAMIVVFGSLSSVVPSVRAVAPSNILSYQGRLLNSNGVPISDSSVLVEFRLFTALTGGTCVWSNSSATCDTNTPASTVARTVTLTSGLFSENLGDTSIASPYLAISDSTFADNATLFLEVEVAGETLSPRKRVTAAAYAMNASTLDGIDSGSFLRDTGDTGTGDYSLSNVLTVSASSTTTTAIVVTDTDYTNALSIGDNHITGTTANIDLTNFDVAGSTGNVSMSGDLTISGDDLFMATNTSGFILVADGTNYNPVAISSDATLSSAGALTISANAVALSTDTTGNYVATLADAGGLDFTISGSGSEGAAVTIDIAADAVDFDEMVDSMSLDAATDINLGANLFSIDLDSTGDFAVRDGTTNLVLFEDDSTIDVTFPATGFLTINASTISNETTTGVIDLNISAGIDGVDGINVSMSQKDGVIAGADATAFEVLLTGNDADGDMFGLTITGAATANAGAGTYEALLSLTNNENTAGAVSDAIVITSGASTVGSITTGLDFDTTDITTDIEFQNSETLDNNTDGQFLFTRNTDADVTIMGADSSGASNLIIDTTGAGSITVGSADVTSLTVTTDNNAATDVGITGGFTVTSGATHNSFTITSSADTENAETITADSVTSGKALSITGNAITTGFLSDLSSSSTAVSSASLFRTRLTGTFSDATSRTMSGNVGVFSYTPTMSSTGSATLTESGSVFRAMQDLENQSTSGGIISVSGSVARVDRTSTNSGSSTFTVTGPVLSVINDVSSGSVTDSGNVISVQQNYASASGDGVNVTYVGIGEGIHVTMSTINSPAANSVSNQALVLDINETFIGGATTDAVFLIRSDADGTADTEFRIEGDGDFSYDGTGSSPASDLAEVYPSNQILVAGDLVMLDPSGNLNVSKADGPYQSNLFGAVSTKPAIRMGDDKIGYDVALLGRIPLKISSENGSISIGDPLTSSTIAGHAMKATEPGTIVGYALEAFDGSGIGVITAYINVGWYAGNVIGTDGTSTILTDRVVVAPLGTASSSSNAFNSNGFSLRGSRWNGSYAENVDMSLVTTVESTGSYRLSIRNTTDTEIAYVSSDGTMSVSGSMIVSQYLYPSDRGTPQTSKYIYYDGSSGPGGDFMRTNASGWSTGSYDFAEMFPSTESLEPGDVVVFGVDVTHVRRSVEHSDSHIAGVVSTRPGFLAGENTPGQYPIALAGRVPTKISLENGPIQVGDAITTSSRVGFAMKANKNGTIVGYALEPYTQTTTSEKIIVFVRPGYTGTIEVQPLIGSDNRASQLSSASNFTQLNMSGDIFMTSYSILGVGRIAGLGDVWSIEQDGTIKTASLLKNVIQSYTGEKVETTAMTSPDALITLI